MKDLTFYDHRHGNVYIVRNPKSRVDARKILNKNLLGTIFDKFSIDSVEENVVEVESVIEFNE